MRILSAPSRRPNRLGCAALFALVTLLAAPSPAQDEAPSVQPAGVLAQPWDRYLDEPELVALMQRMARQWPDYLRLVEVGKSAQGRTIWALEVNDPATGAIESKPAMYVDGNIHGNEIQASETALYMVWYLLKHRESVPRLREILARASLYVLPTVNPDGRAFWFREANTASTSRGGQIPTDNDGDGRLDEDGPDDLDGDGHITQMRKQVPLGTGSLRRDPQHPDRLIPVGPGEKGDWIVLGTEGIDNDGDGRVNEDGPGGYDPNRDWGSDWQPSYVQWGARRMPFSLPESRVVRDYIIARPNIAGSQAYHNMGGMLLRGPGNQASPYPAEDVRLYDELGRKGEEMIPFYRYLVLWKDLYRVHGGFVDWMYLGQGVLSFTNELWTPQRLLQSQERLPREKRDELLRDLTFGAHDVPWKEYEHPVYGRIEIGGAVKHSGRIPPGFLIQESLHRNSAWVLYQTSELPELEALPERILPAGEGQHWVEFGVRNLRLTPTRTAIARERHIGRPDLLEVAPEGCQVLAGGFVRGGASNRFRPATTELFAAEIDPLRVPIEAGVPSRGELRLRYLVAGTGRLVIRYTAEKAKDLRFVLEVGR